MARSKKPEEEKFIPYSITIPPDLDKIIRRRGGGVGLSSTVRGDLESYYELLAAGRNLARKRFTRREVLAVIDTLERQGRLVADPGQIVRWVLGDLATDIEEENQWISFERRLDVSGKDLVDKVRQAGQLEILGLLDCARDYLQLRDQPAAIEILALFASSSTSQAGFTTGSFLDAQAEHTIRGGYLLNLGGISTTMLGKQGQVAGESLTGHTLYAVADHEEALGLGRTVKDLELLAPTFQERK